MWAFLFNCLTRLLLRLLALGPVPRHVAFVMDGNRRFARLRGQRVVEGHLRGFESLRTVSPVERERV